MCFFLAPSSLCQVSTPLLICLHHATSLTLHLLSGGFSNMDIPWAISVIRRTFGLRRHPSCNVAIVSGEEGTEASAAAADAAEPRNPISKAATRATRRSGGCRCHYGGPGGLASSHARATLNLKGSSSGPTNILSQGLRGILRDPSCTCTCLGNQV